MLRWLLRGRRDRPTGEANPFEVYLLTLGIITGVYALFTDAQPTSISALLPPWMRVLWAFLLLAGGALALIGLYWPGDPFTGVEIKRVGLVAAGVGTFAWGIAAAFLGVPGVLTAVFNIGFALACLTRMVQVTRRIRYAREHLQAVHVAAAELEPPTSGTEGSGPDGGADHR